jgi:hypothetical protein
MQMMQKRTISWNGIVCSGILVPDRVDERGDIVFRYNGVS